MDITRAKEFMIIDDYYEDDHIIISDSIEKILERTNNSLIGVYGVIDTPDGEVLMTMDWSYSGEPIMMRRFLHRKFFINEFTTKEIIRL